MNNQCETTRWSDEGEEKVLIIYGERDDAVRAMTMLRRLEDAASGQPKLSYHLWRYDVLDLPEAQLEAEAGFERSHWIVIAATQETEIELACAWLSRDGLSRCRPSGGLLALLRKQPGGLAQAEHRLRTVAERAGLDLLVLEMEDQSPLSKFENSRQYRSLSHAEAASRWGINE